jgi:hypothetical protein
MAWNSNLPRSTLHFWIRTLCGLTSKRILEHGSDPPRVRGWTKIRKKLVLEAALLRGNQKSVNRDDEGLAALLIDDVTRRS